MNKITKILLLYFFCGITVSSHSAGTTFSYVLGGYEAQYASQSVATNDGGHLVLGGILGLPNSFRYNAILLKLDRSGQIQWKKVLSPGDTWSISKTKDGGCVVTFSKAVVKLNKDGDVQWQRRLGYLYSSTHQTSTGGFIAIGSKRFRMRVTMLGSDGSVQWDKTYSICRSTSGVEALETPDGAFIIAANTTCHSETTNTSQHPLSLLKIDALGAVIWQRAYLDNSAGYGLGAMTSAKGGYVLLARNSQEIAVLKVDQRGAIKWQTKLNVADHAKT